MEIPWNEIARYYFAANAFLTFVLFSLVLGLTQPRTKADLTEIAVGVPVSLTIGMPLLLFVVAQKVFRKISR